MGGPVSDALETGKSVGFLAIDPSNRRRNRMNGRITATTEAGFKVAIDQTFGNCPQNIQTRAVSFHREPAAQHIGALQTLSSLSEAAKAAIATADTSFVTSYTDMSERSQAAGVDASHRGKPPGFVKVEGNTQTIPNFPGNNASNPFGNFEINLKAGLLFPDFETGDLINLAEGVEMLSESDHPKVTTFRGVERAWRLT